MFTAKQNESQNPLDYIGYLSESLQTHSPDAQKATAMCVTPTLILTGSKYGHVQCWSHSVVKNENFKKIAIFSQEEFKCKFSFINVGN